MSKINVYAIVGFLSTGKTHFINDLVASSQEDSLIISFEEGLTKYKSKAISYTIPKDKDLIQLQALGKELKKVIAKEKPKKIYLEWNGMAPFSQLEQLIYHTSLGTKVNLAKVIYITNFSYCLNMMGRTGEGNLSQLGNCDFAVLMGDKNNKDYYQSAKLLKDYVPTIKIHNYTDGLKGTSPAENLNTNPNFQLIKEDINYKKDRINQILWSLLIGLGLVYGCLEGDISLGDYDKLVKVLNVFSGIVLQAMPFLLLGIIISATVQIYLPATLLEKLLSGNPVKATLSAIGAGFIFPVCDCATIPIFRSLVLRKIPISIGLVFMLSCPVINPIVILSTYYAFSGNMVFVLGRVIVGIITALIVALTFVKYKGLKISSTHNLAIAQFQNNYLYNTMNLYSGKKWQNFLITTQNEFYRIGGYLTGGAFLSACFQVYLNPLFTGRNVELSSLALAVLMMMVVAYLLSLCSTSDAMIGRSFASIVPLPTVMGFLAFSPIMDIKNTMLLLSFFPRGFVARLVGTSFVVVFVLAMLFSKYYNLL